MIVPHLVGMEGKVVWCKCGTIINFHFRPHFLATSDRSLYTVRTKRAFLSRNLENILKSFSGNKKGRLLKSPFIFINIETDLFSQPPGLREFLEGPVIGFFGLRGEAAAGEFAVFEVGLDTIATQSPFSAGTISTAAFIRVFLLFAFHSPAPIVLFLIQ
jgi:hypothetical protein